MEALDGNAIGGLLLEVFGEELTASTRECGSCGARAPLAEVRVYRARRERWCAAAAAAAC